LANLFNKKFEEITFEDIEEMVVDKVPEGFMLDYKERFDTALTEKLICALANTYGGFIIYGVKCSPDNNLPAGIRSIREDRKLDDRVDSISTYNISPPVFCDCRYLGSRSKKREVFIVRVPESDRTPHAANNNRDVYVKIAGQKKKYDRADMNRLEWLRDKRKRHIEVREKLLNDLIGHRILQAPKPSPLEYTIGATVYPQYPKDRLIEYYSLRKFAEEQFTKFSTRQDTIVRLRNEVHVDNGLCAYVDLRDLDRKIRYYFEFNVYGLCSITFYVEKNGEPKENQVYVPLLYTTMMLHMAVDLGNAFLDALDFRGVRRVDMEIAHIKNTRVNTDMKGFDGILKSTTDGRNTVQDSIVQCFDITPGECEVQLQTQITDFVGRIVHLYGAYDDSYACATSLANTEFRRISRPVLTEVN